MAQSDGSDDPRFRRNLVRQAKAEMWEARKEYRRVLNHHNRVPPEIRQLLATQLMQYYDSLFEYKDNNQQVQQAWEDCGLLGLEELEEETATVEVEAPGDTSATNTIEQPKLLQVSAQQMIEWSKQLDYIANALGLGRDVETGRPFGRIGGPERWED